MLRDYLQQCEAALRELYAQPERDVLMALCRERLLDKPHGDLPRWLAALNALPEGPAECDLSADTLRIGQPGEVDPAEVKAALQGLIPWRKGPFDFFGVHIDTEWHSDWKWQRVAPHLSPLAGRRVLDVGCGSGYHCWRMAAAGAKQVVGIDPTILFLVQYLAVRRFAPSVPVWFLPLRMEELPTQTENFDTVFSMGVLYHRRSPLNHLMELRQCLRPGGELVLETLIIDGQEGMSLIPEERYAKMRNVWFIPSIPTMLIWLRRCGYKNVRCVDENLTSLQEQRATEWMTFESLADFLDPQDVHKPIEGYPAPKRAVFIADAP